jgi:hypothetical protein
MADSADVKGFDEVIKNLNIEILAIRNRTSGGLVKAAALVRNETETGEARTPVDLGNLRASWFVVTAKSVPVGRGVARFNGPKLGRLLNDHVSTIQEAQATVRAAGKENIFIMAGYSAHYAVYVHEMVGANFKRKGRGKSKGKNATFKWLQRAFVKHKDNMLRIIRDNAKIKR